MEGSISPGPAILALKEVYRFCLLIDEAHSFMALGSNGRGSFNHWQDAGYRCPMDGVDVMSCMFSKSVGCTGGFVLAKGPFAVELRRQGEVLTNRGIEKLSTIVLLRILGLLRKPLFIQHRMRLVREKAGYVARALTAAGCKVLSSTGSAIICFPVGESECLQISMPATNVKFDRYCPSSSSLPRRSDEAWYGHSWRGATSNAAMVSKVFR